jgi:hypothetical protein
MQPGLPHRGHELRHRIAPALGLLGVRPHEGREPIGRLGQFPQGRR